MNHTKQTRWLLVGLAVLLALATSFSAFAQRSNGSIGGNAAPGDEIHVSSVDSGFERHAVAGSNGKYRFSSVPTGTYRITITRGDEVVVQATVTVRVGSTTRPPTPVAPSASEPAARN